MSREDTQNDLWRAVQEVRRLVQVKVDLEQKVKRLENERDDLEREVEAARRQDAS